MTVPREPGRVIWRARLVVACLGLTALCFRQAPGLVVPDTKLDLTANPGGFLARALHLWDPQGAFGQLQNQAYGYLLPAGPFHWALDGLAVPDWITQRLWWSVVLCTAFLGVWKVTGALGIGTPWARFAAALLYALSPRMLGEVAITSVEVWPMAMAPWVLLPLVTSRARSGWWRVAWSAVAFGLVGGVNAVATGATLVLPFLWLITRRPSRFMVKTVVGWLGCVTVVSVWWLVPLMLLGRYSPPFLDWIENASVTTGAASVFESWRGTSHWLNFLTTVAGPSWPAGWLYVTSPALILQTALVAVLGLAGLASGSLRHRGFLALGAAAGLVLLTLGHDGPAAAGFRELLDGPFAALRNTHKFELVVRLPLAIAAAHALTRCAQWLAIRGVRPWLMPVLAACLLVSVATPGLAAQLPRPEGYPAIAEHWRQAARWLDDQPAAGSVLVVPAASFADFTWGSTKDEPFQVLLKRPIAVRDAVPLGSAGATRWLDEVERRLATGVGDPALRLSLARAGVRYVVVRNDLRVDAQGSSPVAVHETLAESGLERVAAFGPNAGSPIETPATTLDERSRLPYPSVEIFETGAVRQARVVPVSRLVTLQGGAEDVPTAVSALGPDGAAVVGSDSAGHDEFLGGVAGVLTDGHQRRETSMGRPADNVSEVLTAADPGRLRRRTLDYVADARLPRTTRVWSGVAGVRASSSASDADATLRLGPGNGPAAAVDGDTRTRWVSGTFGRAAGEWFELTFPGARDVEGLTVRFSRRAPVTTRIRAVRVDTDNGSVRFAVASDEPVSRIPTPAGPTQRLRITVDAVSDQSNGVAIEEIGLPGLKPVSRLRVPRVSPVSPAAILFRTQQVGRSGCLHVGTRPLCSAPFGRDAEEPTGLRRIVDLPAARSYRLQGTALPRDGTGLERLLELPGAVRAVASSRAVTAPEGRPGAAVDRDLGTGWVAARGDTDPRLRLTLPRRRVLTGLQFLVDQFLAASRPQSVTIRIDGRRPFRATLDAESYVRFRPRPARRIEIGFVSTEQVYTVDSGTGFRQAMPVGVSEVRLLGADDSRRALDLEGRSGSLCEFGPAILVDGFPVPTRVQARIRDVLQRRPVEIVACGDREIDLGAGQHTIDVAASNEFVPVAVSLITPDPLATGPPVAGATVRRPDPARLTVDVPARTEPAVLAVPQNFSTGWQAFDRSGQTLKPIRIDGWQQGWIVPAGEPLTVTARFTPDRSYRAGLLVGAVGILLVAGIAVGSRRRSRRSVHRLHPASRLRPALVMGIALATGTFVAGWPGMAAVAAAVVAAWLLSLLTWRPGSSGGRGGGWVIGLVAAAGGVAAVLAASSPWPVGSAGLDSAVIQALVLFGFALAVLSPGATGDGALPGGGDTS